MFQEYSPGDLLGPLNDVERKLAPQKLFLQGDSGLFKVHPRVAIVGSRKASEDGVKRAQKLARLLAKNCGIVVSGLAEGIDTAAHKSAIAAGGRTIAVIGTPLDKSYPRSNATLQNEIARDHALLSQFPSGHPTLPRNFPMRNHTMALISCATVIVEAGETSGSLSQGWEALRLGRLLFIMESVVSNPLLKWPKKMRDYGAQVLSDENVDFFLESLPFVESVSDGDAIAV